jgi:hypothetical protein
MPTKILFRLQSNFPPPSFLCCGEVLNVSYLEVNTNLESMSYHPSTIAVAMSLDSGFYSKRGITNVVLSVVSYLTI